MERISNTNDKYLEIIKKKFKSDSFADNFGIVIDNLKEDFIKMHMILSEKHNNLFGRPHGGAIYSLADAAFSVIANNGNNLSVALECSIVYHSSPDPGSILYVEGKKIHQSRRIGTYEFVLYTNIEEDLKESNKTHKKYGEKRKLVATMKSLVYRTGKPIDPEYPVG